MKRILLVLFCLLAFPVTASHIVGGEFEIIYLSPNRYRINLIIYFDEKKGSQDAKDPSITARIFRLRDNFPMMNVVFNSHVDTPVSYTQPECSDGKAVTTKMVYSTVVTISDSFNDDMGYYIAWERCCRNYELNNIDSQNPNTGGQYAGQTFYLEFPAVVKNGLPFINSSPHLFPPLNDYGCAYKPYYVDFAGTDEDDDSLVYSLVVPLNTKSGDAFPPGNIPRPRPYPPVVYQSNYGLSNIMGGRPDMHITADGFLTVTPTRLGLFGFAVKCEEYRDGKKIGEVRRDFQLLVVDCPAAEPPKIKGKKGSSIYEETMTVTFSNTVPDEQRCIQVEVSDPDASKASEFFQEKIKIKAIPLNFSKKKMPDILPAVSNAILTNGSTVTFDICFKDCPPVDGGIYQIGIVAYDDACSLPLTDTLRVTINQEPPPNAPPLFNLSSDVAEIANEGELLSWSIVGTDADLDSLTLGVIVDGFVMKKVGMSLTTTEQSNGLYKADLVWDTRCDFYDFNKKTNFHITLLLEDQNWCPSTDADILNFDLGVVLPGNADPVISSNITSAKEIEISRKIFETLDFQVIGKDADNDKLDLFVNGIEFSLDTYGIVFPPVTGVGHVQSPFHWNITCAKHNLALKNEFDFEFVVLDDNNYCRIPKSDTLMVKVKLDPPENTKPDLQIVNTNPELLFVNNEQALRVGQQISLALIAKDRDRIPDADRISIEMIEARGSVDPVGYEFAPASGEGTAETTFVWNTACSIFEQGIYENTYTFTFKTEDNRCLNPKGDTVDVNFVISDIDAKEAEFIPPNFISPNEDGSNDFFAMLRINPDTQELESILPRDNCVGRFVGISIYNRWGKEIFQSNSRDFRWYPVNEASGIYFYTVVYSNRDYKGSITLRD
jgi:hypothetical protein